MVLLLVLLSVRLWLARDMLITKNLTIPPYTPPETPVETVIEEIGLTLYSVDILFPEGCLFAAGVKVLTGGQQLVPFGSNWLVDNDKIITVRGPFRLQDTRRVVLRGYNIASDWPHTITFRLDYK